MLNPKITAKEMEVYKQLSEGLLYKEIASNMGFTIDSVKKHCKTFTKK